MPETEEERRDRAAAEAAKIRKAEAKGVQLGATTRMRLGYLDIQASGKDNR
jgi:hypothetical protein